jgi:Ti-type conjugative transfer relaxase TraA
VGCQGGTWAFARLRSVVSIGKLGGGGPSERYYLDQVAGGREDYYTGRGEAHGRWWGTGAGELELSGRVEADALSRLLQGQAPGGGGGRLREVGEGAVTAFDVTFSAPKSVSVLFGVGDERIAGGVAAGHDAAVQEALGYLEREAAFTRRGRGGARQVAGEGLTVARFRHRTSRAGDPQLHTHALVANLIRAEGTWGTLDGRLLYAHARTAGFLYQAALRRELTERLGVEWGPVHRGTAEVLGIDRQVREHFSRRRAEIVERMREVDGRSASSAQAAALETRRVKDYDVPLGRLREQWRARAAEHGLDQEALGHAVDRDPEPPAITGLPLRELTREASTFDRRAVIRAVAEHAPSGARVREIEAVADEVLRSPEVTRVDDRGRYSTWEMLELERDLLKTARQSRGRDVARVPGEVADAVLAERVDLSGEQREVVRALTTSGDGVQVVRAPAGTGKTFALEAARQVWEQDGRQVFGAALSARAALELEQHAGIDSCTIARLKDDLQRGFGPDKNDVLIVDEAAMVGTRDLARLVEHTGRAGAKLVLVGDDRQLQEIDAGGAFRRLAKDNPLALSEVRRQREQWDRDALSELRDGQLELFADAYLKHGRIVARPTAEKVRETLVSDWWQAARQPGCDAVMIAHRRSDVADLNQRAREARRAHGDLGPDELNTGERAFAAGDRVIATRNARDLDLANGQRGTITTINPEHESVSVHLDGDIGREVQIDHAYLAAGHLDHAYAITAHKAQGATVDQAFVLGTEDLYREWGYTALSRHRDQARFYLVSPSSVERSLPGLGPDQDPLRDQLAQLFAERRQKTLAHDHLSRDLGDLRLERDQNNAAHTAARVEHATDEVGRLQVLLEQSPFYQRRERTRLRETLASQEAKLLEHQERAATASKQLTRSLQFDAERPEKPADPTLDLRARTDTLLDAHHLDRDLQPQRLGRSRGRGIGRGR